MIKKTITYEDFNGEKQTEDFYFHLTKSELLELELGFDGGLSAYLSKLTAETNPGAILTQFKKIVEVAYGTRSLDGKRFTKDAKETDAFMHGPAFDVFFMELVQSESAVVEFIMGIVPKDLLDSAEAREIMAGNRLLSDVQLPESTFSVGEQERLYAKVQPMPPVGPDVAGDVPAAFRRPPADRADRMIDPGAIELPEELLTMTREEILKAYDQQMNKNREGGDPAA